jgi:hypothetical protein
MKKKEMRKKYLKAPPDWILGTIKRVEFVRYNRESFIG